MSWLGHNQQQFFLDHVHDAPTGPNGHHAVARSNTPHIAAWAPNGSQIGYAPPGREVGGEQDKRLAMFKEVYARSEARIGALFGASAGDAHGEGTIDPVDQDAAEDGPAQVVAPARKAARTIDDDYDDYGDDDDDEDANPSPLKSKSTNAVAVPAAPFSAKPPTLHHSLSQGSTKASSQDNAKTSEDVRKKLEEDKKAAEDAAKRSFHTLFYTLENDRDAMLEQQKLEESDRQVDAEMSGSGHHGANAQNASAGNSQHGTLSSANLGASSLTLKHLIARIDAKRDQVRASDAELRSLMSEVRKNRSKWASEERVGQEELYEAAEKVLSELKAMTEHSTAFLSRVNKREAPDYYTIIKDPMDLGTMTKKLKAVQYKSKKDFVSDLNKIWENCLKYNANPEHFLRKHALYMRKETEKLVPLIPEIVIRDRSEVEAEERRLHSADGDVEGGEESDDEPIMSSRGRKAPGKTSKKGAPTARKAPITEAEGTPGPDTKPSLATMSSMGLGSTLRHEHLRADSDTLMEGSQNGFATPPPGTMTPAVNGTAGSMPPGSQADGMEIDGFGSSVNGIGLNHSLIAREDDIDHDDLEYKTWKQVTKKDRALVAAQRNRLFKGDHLNPEEPALLRTRAGMRRWLRKQRQADAEGASGEQKADPDMKESEDTGPSGETLAEGIEGEEEETLLPDYYDTVAAIPELSDRLRWVEDADGQVIDPSEEFLRVAPKGLFTSPDSVLTRRMEANMRQMQETRKICAKIGIVRQMQIQSQMYQNQFQKYNPEPFVEADIGPHVVSDDGPIMAPWVCRAALQRSVAKVFYHAGFEEFQPSALDVVTDIAGDFFTKLVRTLGVYKDAPKVPAETVAGEVPPTNVWRSKFSTEEIILHCLHENGLDVEALESYVKEDVERLSSKLSVVHERMKAHLADQLRPGLGDAGPDGSLAFNDGSEQFVGGDFAEEIEEDFFGFKELGLDKEFGLGSLSVPFHLLQNRMHNAYQAQNASATSSATNIFQPPPPFEPVTIHNVKSQIGLVQNFFLAKLHANKDEPLVEDDDLPQKQRLPKPRLPPTGKISSPRKRPLKEPGPGGNAKKKKKAADGSAVPVGGGTAEDGAAGAGASTGKGLAGKPPGKLKLHLPTSSSGTAAAAALGGGGVAMERLDSGKGSEIDKDEGGSAIGGMMSPESLEAT